MGSPASLRWGSRSRKGGTNEDAPLGWGTLRALAGQWWQQGPGDWKRQRPWVPAGSFPELDPGPGVDDPHKLLRFFTLDIEASRLGLMEPRHKGVME